MAYATRIVTNLAGQYTTLYNIRSSIPATTTTDPTTLIANVQTAVTNLNNQINGIPALLTALDNALVAVAVDTTAGTGANIYTIESSDGSVK